MRLDVSKIVTLDFETFFDPAQDYSLRSKKMNTSEYIRDDRFLAHCIGIKIGAEPVETHTYEDIGRILKSIDWATHDLLAHNAAFDGFVLAEVFNIWPRRYFDTLSMGRGLHGQSISASLDSLASIHQLGNKTPSVLDRTRGKQSLDKETLEALCAYCAQDVELCFLLFLKLVVQMPPKELELIDLTIRMFCQPKLCVDQARASTELQQEIGTKVAALLLSGLTAEDLLSNNKLAELLKNHGVAVPMKISKRTGLRAPAFAKKDAGFKALLEHPDQQVRNIMKARLKIKSTIGETRAARLIEAGKDGNRLPVLLNYAGAHTLRWSAGNRMNMQNFPRGGELRKSIIAPPEHMIVVCDASQIEARILAWLAEQDDVVEAFREWDASTTEEEKRLHDIYRIAAAEVYGVPVAELADELRFIGKVCRLGLGFGMGPDKLKASLAEGMLGLKPIDMSLEDCVSVVTGFRERNSQIVSLWRALDRVIAQMMLGQGGQYKCISWGPGHIKLPNGMKLLYPELRRSDSGFVYRTRTGFSNIYGGLLTENIVQALARCVIADHMLEIDKHYPVVSMTHDEVMVVAPEGQAKQCLDLMMSVMKTPPTWAPDLPLNSEGIYERYYAK